MASKIAALHKAKKAADDEWYTVRSDIEAEIPRYAEDLRGKHVYCPCDSTASAFYQYFKDNYQSLGLTGLTATCYAGEKVTWDGAIETITPLENGSFDSEECKAIMAQVDVVITNPPYSKWRVFMAQLWELGKPFLVVGGVPAQGYKDVTPHLASGEIVAGGCLSGMVHNGEFVKRGCDIWFSNLSHKRHHPPMKLTKHFDSKTAVFTDEGTLFLARTDHIPVDYDDWMLVPVSFFEKFCPEQFEASGTPVAIVRVNGVRKFERIKIRRRRA